MLFDKWGVVVEVTNKKESNKMPLFFGHSQNSNPDIETVLFFSQMIRQWMHYLLNHSSQKMPRN